MAVTDTELAWAAGIIDGEGCITITRYGPKGKRHGPYYRGILKVGNSDPRMIIKLTQMFGCGITLKPAKTNRLPQYIWQKGAHDAVEVLKQVRPYLVNKADQADVLLAFYQLKPKYERASPTKGHLRLSDDDHAIRREMFESIKTLKTPPEVNVSSQ